MRRSRHAAPALAALAAIVLVGCSPLGDESGPAVPARALPMLVLQPGDLGEAFVRFDEGPLALADAPGGERSDPARFGRQGGWKARYRRQGAAQSRGPLVVESRVDLFEGSGAERELDRHRAELELQARSPSDLELAEIPSLGEEAYALAPSRRVPPGSFVSVTVAWRDANLTASVTANGLGGRFRRADVLALARAQQRRIEHALPPS